MHRHLPRRRLAFLIAALSLVWWSSAPDGQGSDRGRDERRDQQRDERRDEGRDQGRTRADERVWTFEDGMPGSMPSAFEPGLPPPPQRPDGRWQIVEDGRNKVLAQVTEAEGDNRIVVARGTSFQDVSLSVRLRGVGGDRAGGIVWRYTGSGDHYLARLNLDQQRVNIFRVVRGTRSRIASIDGLEVDVAAWHLLKVEQRGEQIRVWLDGIPVADARDRTIQGAGAIGLWTSPDSSAWFDDLRASALRDR